MAKRKVSVESNEQDQLDSSQASKRVRTQSGDDQCEVVPPQVPKREKKPAINGKGKDKAAQEESSDDEGSIHLPQQEQTEEDEKRFEEENGERVRAAIEAKRNTFGGIADHGIIEHIEMHQFMCHRFLSFTFGPQINFIIGHNGSGKSAVLSAITVALGGKATSTGRGNGLKSFIREGQDVAEVTITIKNQGEEAFKPKEYGKNIIVTRRFKKDGSSSWKIRSKDGKIVSTKKDELAAICDHMNIQVDNPLNVLTQDSARQFLSASHPSDKYKFFLRGTQLSQLNDEYDACLENINQTTKVLGLKKAALPDLRVTFKEASMRFEEASKAREQKYKADELKKELAWAHVAGKEEDMTKKIEEVAKLKRRLPKIEEEVQNAESEFKAATEQVTRLEEELKDIGDIDHLNEKRSELQEKLRVNRNKIKAFNDDAKQMDQGLQSTRRAIAGYEARIAEETRRMEVHTQAKRAETNQQLERAKAQVQEVDRALSAILDQKRAKIDEQSAVKNEGLAADAAKNTAKDRITECQTMITRCRDQEKNSLAPYGRDIKNVLAQVAKMNWYGDVPVGPLGTFVKVKDPKSWAQVLRSTLGGFMTAWACTDARDRQQLKRLLDQSGNSNLMIIISSKDMFDYSSGEPPAGVLTVLRAMDFSDPFVLRILVNQANIERTILARTRLEGQQILDSLGGGGTAWTADGMRVQKYSDGGKSSNKLQEVPRGDSRNMLFTSSNTAMELRDWEENLKAAESQHLEAQAKSRGLEQTYREYTRTINALTTDEKNALRKQRETRNGYKTLQEEANEELPTDIAGLQSAKEEAEAERDSILEQFTTLTRQKDDVNAEQKPLLEEQNRIQAQIDAFKEGRDAVTHQIEEAVAARLQAQNSKKHYTQKLDDEKKKVADAEEIATQLKEEFANWTTSAEDYCEKVQNPRKADVVKRHLESVQTALKERERRHGATVEEMTIEVNKAKAALDTAEKDLRSLNTLNKALTQSLITRLQKWQEFRRHIALRCKHVFQYHLSNRGYYGKVLFDHINQTLQLKVQTDDQTATQGRDKDPRSLSGGEKSFSTICLLLSLWDSIGCPLRCLDEFDVFMDAVNRRISMRMMIDTANASDKKQYILITPQDMNNIHIGQTVRVHRMTDPERGQATLPFS